jgi:hypothetical protein
MSAFQTVLSKTNKRRIQKATPEQQALILSSIVKSCRFCQGLHDVKDCEALQNTKCKFCGKKGHSANVRFCEALAQKVERDKKEYEKEREEQKERDEKKEKEEKKEKICWSSVVQSNRPSSMVLALEKANEEADRLKKEKQAKNHADYLARCEARKQRQEEHKARYVADMLERFGSRWFNFVKVYRDGEFNTDIAEEYRWKYEREQEEREYEREIEEYRMEQIEKEKEKEREKEKEKKREHNKKTMTRQEFNRWEQEEEEKEHDEIDLDLEYWESQRMSRTGYYERQAPEEYAQYCFNTGIMLDYRAKEIENNRLMKAWEKEKQEKK